MGDWRLAVDIGGTFTDVVLLDAASGEVLTEKALTTPADPLVGLRRGVEALLSRSGVEARDVHRAMVHATTLVTNALIEGKGARTALVTTEGFADTLLIRNEHRYDMYDLQIEFPPPPVPRELTFEIAERTTADGTLRQLPDDGAVDALAERLRAASVEAVAVCFLHSYANPDNERRVGARLAERLGLPVSLSSEVAPQIREYPRAVTTACNAMTMPLVNRYFGELESWLREQGIGEGLLIMLSNGGVAAPDVAMRMPIRLAESGPAAGALAGAWYAARLGEPRLLCFDMGGTTAKACLIEGGEPALSVDFEVARVYRFKKGSGYPVTVPSIDLVEIGAGGGSLARIDPLGLLKVGPESSGAEPGPACYGRGGTAPAVTDADLLLGYLDADYFLGGDMRLDRAAAERSVGALATQLGVPLEDAAMGIHEVVNQNMAASARMHGVERGVDLRGVTLLAFGGAGPVHACGVAELLQAERVVFPSDASVLSAFGTLVTPVRVDLARTLVRPLYTVQIAERDALLQEMREQALNSLAVAGIAAQDVRVRFGVDARYSGQGHEITVWMGEGAAWPVDGAEAMRRYEREYERVYGVSIPGVPVEVVTWRIAAYASAPSVRPLGAAAERKEARPKRLRPAVFTRGVVAAEVAVYERRDLPVGAVLVGPAIVEQRDTTTVLRPGWRAEVASDGSLVAHRAVVDLPKPALAGAAETA
ncbi:MAG TPA: hydantoinase/oxoprolinase family protein [Candidatus Dormibacteraeota bacterium]